MPVDVSGLSLEEAMGMARNQNQTSSKVASRILTDNHFGKDSKSIAGSALVQVKHSKRSK